MRKDKEWDPWEDEKRETAAKAKKPADWRLELVNAAVAFVTFAVTWGVSDRWNWARLIAVISAVQGFCSAATAVRSWRDAREQQESDW